MLTRINGKLMGVAPFREEAADDGDKGGGGGGHAEDWRTSLPEDLREVPALQDFKDVGSLAKAFVDTKSALGQGIRIPGPDASEEAHTEFVNKLMKAAPNLMLKPNFDDPEQSKEFFRTLGMPESADGYSIPEVEGIEMPEDRANAIKSAALDAGLSGKQFERVVEALINSDAKLMDDYKKGISEGIANLRGEWGAAFDNNYKTAASIAAKTGAPQQLVDAIGRGEVAADTVKWLYELSKKFGAEGQQIINQDNATSGKLTPSEARDRINEIMNNKSHPYWNPSDPGNQDAIKKMVELQRMANPS